jgi:hypothetical protein
MILVSQFSSQLFYFVYNFFIPVPGPPVVASIVAYTIAALLKANCRREALELLSTDRHLYLEADKTFNPSPIYMAMKQTNSTSWLPVIFADIKRLGLIDENSVYFTFKNCVDAKQVCNTYTCNYLHCNLSPLFEPPSPIVFFSFLLVWTFQCHVQI